MSQKTQKNTNFKIEFFDPEKLTPYALNNKKHDEDQINRLANVIESQGFDVPIVTDSNMVIIKGHGRRLAAIKLGMKLVPVIVRRDLSQAEADAARISDNITVSLKYDTQLMQEELTRLLKDNDFGLDADMMGLNQKEKDLFMGDIEMPDFEALMEDTHSAMEEQKKQDEKRVKETDAEQIKVTEAFGFKTVSASDQRIVLRFQAYAEELTGMVGKEAFISALEGIVKNAAV